MVVQCSVLPNANSRYVNGTALLTCGVPRTVASGPQTLDVSLRPLSPGDRTWDDAGSSTGMLASHYSNINTPSCTIMHPCDIFAFAMCFLQDQVQSLPGDLAVPASLYLTLRTACPAARSSRSCGSKVQGRTGSQTG